MNFRKLRPLGCVCVLGVAACGTVSVQYDQPIASLSSASSGTNTDSRVTSIVAEAAKGGQTVVLPVSRLVVVGSPVRTQNNNANAGAVQGDAPPPPNQPAAAPTHPATKGKEPAATTPKPAQIGTQPAPQAAQQAGGNPPAKSTDGATPAPSVTTTFISADGTIQYAVNVVQVESAVTLSFKPTNDFFSQNDFSVTRLANTRIPTTVSNTFTDETASRVKAIASIAAAIIPLAAAAAPSHGGTTVSPGAAQCLTEYFVVDDEATKATVATSWKTRKVTWLVNQGTGGKCLEIALTADPLAFNLVPIASLAAAIASKTGGDWTKVWPVPACMTVHATIKPQGASDNDGRAATGQLTVIDPDYVELLPIPKKGKIAMHPICGADLADSATDSYQADFDTINAITAAFPAQKTSK